MISLQDLLSRRDFSKSMFALFVEVDGLQLQQEDFFSKMKAWTGVIGFSCLPSTIFNLRSLLEK